MDNSNKLDNQGDGISGSYEDNKDDGVVGTDADDAGYQVIVDPGSIKAGKNSGYKGPGNTALVVGDPRFA